MVGRPSKLTPELVEVAGKLAAAGFTVAKIAVSIGITEKTAYAWIREGKASPEADLKAQFCQAIHAGWIQTGKNYLQNLKEQSNNGSTTAATWFLTHHPFFRDDFSDAAADRRVEKRTVAQVIDAIAASGLPPEQLRTVLLNIQSRGLAGDLPLGGDDDADPSP